MGYHTAVNSLAAYGGNIAYVYLSGIFTAPQSGKLQPTQIINYWLSLDRPIRILCECLMDCHLTDGVYCLNFFILDSSRKVHFFIWDSNTE